MKKIIFIIITVLMMSACSSNKSLYSWGDYQSNSYNYLKNSDDESNQELLETFQNIIENQKGTRGIVPPGVYADYGFLLIQANKVKEGKEMLKKEIALYPESKVFIDRILERLEK